ncbi:MAG: DUF421 domain-containing protein [Bacillota bacterium]
MDFNWTWKAILIVLVGTTLLRIAGRKSIAQMTVAQTVIMIAIGSLLIQPVSGRNIWTTFFVATILVLSLMVLEYIQLKSNFLEKIVTGKSKIVIQNGVINTDNLRKMRMTVDQLEIQLRQNQVAKITDVEYATLEPNGRLGIKLKESARPATKEDIQNLINLINMKMPTVPSYSPPPKAKQGEDIFTEIDNANTQPQH